MMKEIKPDSKILDKLETVRKNANAEEFLKNRKADKASASARKLERKQQKTQENMTRARELVEQAKEYREEAKAAAEMKKKSSLAATIIKGYFAYKFAKLLLSPVYCGYGYGMGGSMPNLPTGDEVLWKDNPSAYGGEERAQAIEATQQICDEVSQEAMQKGLIDEPVLSDEDREKMNDLASISRDSENPEQMEQYAAKCQELGLDYNDAKEAFSQNRTINDVENDIEHSRDDINNDIAGMELSM